MVRVSSGPTDDHEFHAMQPYAFELFARDLHGADDDVVSTGTYGTTGYEQYGIDHYAFRKTSAGLEFEVGQSKAYERVGPQLVRKAVDKFLDHWDTEWKARDVKRFVLFVGCVIKSKCAAQEIINQTIRLAQLGIVFEACDATGIYGRLFAPSARRAVSVHLGQQWIEHCFGKQANPLIDITPELMRGDFGALSAAGFVGRLNKAESARIQDLRRRVRKGEAAEVRKEINEALSPIALAAVSDEVHAQFLRLSAAMRIVGEDPDSAKAEIEKADGLDGGRSERLRAMLTNRLVGPQATIDAGYDVSDPDVAEVVAVAYLRLGQHAEAAKTLQAGLALTPPSAETLRIASFAQLASGDRDGAVGLARQAVGRDGESRPCQQALAIALFARAVSPSFDVLPSDWPAPVDLALVLRSDQAHADLEEARRILSELAADPNLAGHRDMVTWSFAVHASMPWAKPSAEDILADLVAKDRLIGPVVTWALSRGLPLKMEDARHAIGRERAEKPDDNQLLLIDIALSSASRDRTRARALLDEGRTSLFDADLGSYHRYWTALLDIEDGRAPTKEALEEWPWLSLRLAIKIRYKKRRMAEVAKIAEKAMQADGDPRILLATVQILFDASQCGTAAAFADGLVERIGTPDAITLAAHVLHRAEQPDRAIAALDRIDAFPDRKLPPDLERLRIACNADRGHLVEAAEDLSNLAEITGAPSDVLTSIEWKLTVGNVPDAKKLYIRHRDRLTMPSPSHIRLAHAVMTTDPKLAAEITRQLADTAPDSLVTAVFELTSRLRLNDEQGQLMKRIQSLGVKGQGGVEMISDISVILERMKQNQKHIEERFERYSNGHLAVQMVTAANPKAFAEQYLGNLVDPPRPPFRPAPVHARYARRYDEGVWPERREDVSLIADLSALLTAHGLGILDQVERAYAPIRVAPDVINAITHMSQKLTPMQPDRLEAARHIFELSERGLLPDPAEVSPIDTFRVTWEPGDGEPSSTLNLSRLIDTVSPALGAQLEQDVRKHLAETIRPDPIGPAPTKSSTLILDSGIAIELHLAGALDTVRGMFDATIPSAEIADRRREIEEADRQLRLATSLETLIERIGQGAKDGTYAFLPLERKPEADLIARQYFQCLKAMTTQGSILWIDDRYTTHIDQPLYPTVTSVEVIDALSRHDRLDTERVDAARMRLRAAGWMFMPVRGDEISRLVTRCTSGGKVVEDDDLSTLRRSTAWSITHRRRLQWPSPEQSEQGVKGEIPYIIDRGSTVAEALVGIWSNVAVNVADARAASAWVLANLDMGDVPPTVIPAGDPRSEFMVGLHLGHLLLVALQITPVTRDSKRRAQYLDFLWTALISLRLRTYPEILDHLLETLERNLVDEPLDDLEFNPIWRTLCGLMINEFADPLRIALLSRPMMRETYGLSDRGRLSLGDVDFDAEEYLRTIIEIVPGEKRSLTSSDGKKASFRLAETDGRPTISATVSRKKHEINDWPRRISSGDVGTRRAALDDMAVSLDLNAGEKDAVAADLEHLEPVARALKVVRMSGDSMTAWYGELQTALDARKALGIWDTLPQDLAPLFRRLQIVGTATIDDAHRQTIASVGLHEAIRRWASVPVDPGAAFAEALEDIGDDEAIAIAEKVARVSMPWNKLFVARLMWERSEASDELRSILKTMAMDAISTEKADAAWRTLSSCARFIAAEAPQKASWFNRTPMERLAAVWSHAGVFTHQLLAAGMEPEDLADVLDRMRLSTPRNLLADSRGFDGDVADPSDQTSERLMIHASAPLLAKMAENEDDLSALQNAVAGMLMDVVDGQIMPAITICSSELAQGDLLGSHLANQAGPLLEAIMGAEIALLAPKIEKFVFDAIDEVDEVIARNAWMRLRAAVGSGPLAPDLAKRALEAARTVRIVSEKPDVGDIAFLATLAVLAAQNNWSELRAPLEEAFETLRNGPIKSDEDNEMLLFEAAFHIAKLKHDHHERTNAFATAIERLAEREDRRGAAVDLARRFAYAMPGTLAQSFVDVIARLKSM